MGSVAVLKKNDGSFGDQLADAFFELTFKSSMEVNDKRDNANINTDAPMGTMLKYGTTASNAFVDKYVIPKHFVKAHKDGYIHMHDKDFGLITFNCCQIDMLDVLKGGFNTGHGSLREPNSIRSYASLSCIVIQSNQNDMFGGQSANAFDYAMAPGVKKTFIKEFVKAFSFGAEMISPNKEFTERLTNSGVKNSKKMLYRNEDTLAEFKSKLLTDVLPNNKTSLRPQDLILLCEKAYKQANTRTEEDTFQAMEIVVCNLNSMHSRAGSQVPFSSLNFGTDTSPEGRLVTKNLLLAVEAGLGNGETPIFPITIFKMKAGVNYNPEDPNYDLFKLAIKVSAKRLFPNFANIDAPFNLQYYRPGDYNTEIAHMGCRTRTIGNTYDKNHEVTGGRGNFSFTTVNLPKIAIEANGDIDSFFEKLTKYVCLAKDQLTWRFAVIAKKHVYNFPFLMGQGVWLGSKKLQPNDTIEEALKQASISIGFCGLAEALIALTGKHHGESDEAQELGLKIVGKIRKLTDCFSEETGLSWSTFATPAENLAGRFAKINKKQFGNIPGVTDREYLTNSFHIPVYHKIQAFKKIQLEAPYHALCNAGHITYVEMDGDPTGNLAAFEKVIRCMHDQGIGYGAVNHPVDRDPLCGYSGIIKNECPHCHRTEETYVETKTVPRIKI